MTRVAQLELQSRYDTSSWPNEMLAEVCRACVGDDEAVYWSGMALREALANAIKHGNKLSPDKRVFVRIEVNGGDELRIAVEDQGEGFDPGSSPTHSIRRTSCARAVAVSSTCATSWTK